MRTYSHPERGAVLIVALLFLVMLTLLGVTAMTSTTMEERMAGNSRDAGIAFQAAEAALRDGRRDLFCYPNLNCIANHPGRGIPSTWHFNTNFGDKIQDGTCNPIDGYRGFCKPAFYNAGTPGGATLPAVPATHSFTGAPSVTYGMFTGAPALQGVSRQPAYLIELFCLPHRAEGADVDPCVWFRITAVGYGANPATTATLQEIVLKLPL